MECILRRHHHDQPSSLASALAVGAIAVLMPACRVRRTVLPLETSSLSMAVRGWIILVRGDRPFASSRAPFLTLGGEVRLRYELIDNTDFGSGPQDNGGYLLTRFMPYAAFTLPNLPAGWELQLFAQFEAASSTVTSAVLGPSIRMTSMLSKPCQNQCPLVAGALSFQGGRQEISSEQSNCSARDTGPMCRSALMVALCAGKIRTPRRGIPTHQLSQQAAGEC